MTRFKSVSTTTICALRSIASRAKKPGAKEPFWDQTALNFLQAVVLYTVLNYPPEQRTLMKVQEIASMGDWDLYQELRRHAQQERQEELAREGKEGEELVHEYDPEGPYKLLM
ncbi:MAG: hypothetical protein AAF417_17185, partial [Pseudomonadota bacterium]